MLLKPLVKLQACDL